MGLIRLYTGYFAQVKKYEDAGMLPVSVSRFTPKWFHGPVLAELAPSASLLNRFKDGRIPVEVFDKQYRAEMASVDILQAIRSLDLDFAENDTYSLVFCCFEKPGDHCHRHILADIIKTRHRVEINEVDVESLIQGVTYGR